MGVPQVDVVEDPDLFRAELHEAHQDFGSWRVLGEIMGYSGAYAYRVAHGTLKPSPDALLRWIEDYRGKYAKIEVVLCCPTCGNVHLIGDCAGKHGQPAIVGDNEEVREKRIYKMSKPEPARHRLTTSIEDYQWMRENGYKSVGDLVAALKETISRDMSILQSQLETQ